MRHVGVDGSHRKDGNDERHRRHQSRVVPYHGRRGTVLDSLALRKERTRAAEGRSADDCGRTLRAGVQPMLLHHRTGYDLSVQRKHHNYVVADIRTHTRSNHTERTRDMEKGMRSGSGMLRSCDADNDKRVGRKCQGGQHMGRRALHNSTVLVRTVPYAVQQTHKAIQRIHHQQVDIPLVGSTYNAFLGRTHRKHTVVCSASKGMVVGRLRGVLRHVRCLSAHDGGAEGAPPYGGEHIQLCPADGGCEREPAHRHGCTETHAVPGNGSCVLRGLARHKVQIKTRHHQSRKKSGKKPP